MSEYNNYFDDEKPEYTDEYFENFLDDDTYEDAYDSMYDEENAYYDQPEDFEDIPYDIPRKKGLSKSAGKTIKHRALRFFDNKDIIDIPDNRRGLKWDIMDLYNKRLVRLLLLAVVFLFLVFIIVSIASCGKTDTSKSTQPKVAAATTAAPSHIISGVPVVVQSELHAACETYACVMLLKSYGFDIDENIFVDNYLITKGFHYENGQLY